MSNIFARLLDGEVVTKTVYPTNMVWGRPSKVMLSKNQTLALARQIRLEARNPIIPPSLYSGSAENQNADNESSGDEIECTGWSGGVVHYVSSDEEPILVSGEEEEVEELSGSELEEEIQRRTEQLAGTTAVEQPAEESPTTSEQPTAKPNLLSVIMGQRTNQGWKKAESTRSLGYNGQSGRTKRHQAKVARDKETGDAKLRKG